MAATKQPGGQISKILSSPLAKNIPLNMRGKSAAKLCTSHPKEGRLAIVTNVAVRRGGREALARRARAVRTAKSCGPDAPMAGVKLAMMLRITRATVTNKPGLAEESTKETVKTIAQGRPDCLR